MTDQDDLQSLPFFVIEMVLSINTYIFILYIYIVYLRYFQPKIVKNTGVRVDSAELTFKQI
jgi:hypothetical protein